MTITDPRVSEEDLAEEVEALRQRNSFFDPVDRPAVLGDRVMASIAGHRGAEPVPQITVDEFPLEIGALVVHPAVDHALVGVTVGEHRSVDAQFTGVGTVTVDVEAKSIAQRVLPELTDEFAEQLDEDDFEPRTVAGLYQHLTDLLSARKRIAAIEDRMKGIKTALAATVDQEPPMVALQAEADQQLAKLEEHLALTDEQRDEVLARIVLDWRCSVALDRAADRMFIRATKAELSAARREAKKSYRLVDGTAYEFGPDDASLMAGIRREKAYRRIEASVVLVTPEGITIDPHLLDH